MSRVTTSSTSERCRGRAVRCRAATCVAAAGLSAPTAAAVVGLARIGHPRRRAESPVPEHQAPPCGGHEQHRDLADGVPGPDVDEQHVDGVGAVPRSYAASGITRRSGRRARGHRVHAPGGDRGADRERRAMRGNRDAAWRCGRPRRAACAAPGRRSPASASRPGTGSARGRGALEHEDHAAAVARDADEQHRREPVAHHRRAERGRQDDQRRPAPAPACPTARNRAGRARRAPARSAARAPAWTRITACVAGSEPRWVAPVSRTARRSTPRMAAS